MAKKLGLCLSSMRQDELFFVGVGEINSDVCKKYENSTNNTLILEQHTKKKTRRHSQFINSHLNARHPFWL